MSVSDYIKQIKNETTVQCPYCSVDHTTSKMANAIFNCSCGNVFRTVNECNQLLCLKMGRPREKTSGIA